MVKRLFLIIVILAMVCDYPAPVFSQRLISEEFIEGDKRIDLGVNCSVFVPDSSKFETGVYVGGMASYDIFRWLAVGMESGYMWTELTSDDVEVGDLHCGTFLGDVILKAPMEMYNFVFAPYAVGGAGFMFSSVDESDNIGSGAEINTNTPFLAKAGLGIDVVLNDTIVMNLEGSYQYAKVKFEENNTNRPYDFNDSKAVNMGFFGGGIKIRF